MRSLLFVPGDSERKLDKARQAGADVLIVDLEDSVGAERKDASRALAAGFLAEPRAADTPRLFVRVNALDSGLAEDDLAAVMGGRPDGIMLPKAEGGDDVVRLAAMLRVHEAQNGTADGATAILPIITETPAGVLAADTYSHCGARLAGLAWGAEDLSAAVGARAARDADGRFTDLFRLARTMTLLAATGAGVAPVDGIFANFRDEAGLRAECAEAERDGFTAKMAIHPAQVPVINAAFTPSDEAVAEAEAVVAAFRAAGDPGVVAIDGAMYDRPHLERARRLLARARAAAR